MTKTKIFVRFFLLILVLILTSNIVLAADSGLVPCGSGSDVSNACTLCHLIVGIYNLVNWGKNILITITIVAIFISGIMYIVSTGTALMEQAKKFLGASIAGFAIVLCGWLMVATVMWVLSAKTDLGIEKENSNWYGLGSVSYTCDTKSTAGSGGGGGTSNPTPPDENSKCCVVSNTQGQGDYGKSSNCSEPQTKTAQQCIDDCNNSIDEPSALQICKDACQDEQTCSTGQLTSGSCSSLAACGGSSAGNDAEIRSILSSNGISVNKSNCQTESQTDCTSLDYLPQNAVDGLIAIKNTCGSFTVTAGTESGHLSHGHNTPIVDIRYSDSLAQCIYNNKSSLPIALECNTSHTYEINCDFQESGDAHFHLKFN